MRRAGLAFAATLFAAPAWAVERAPEPVGPALLGLARIHLDHPNPRVIDKHVVNRPHGASAVCGTVDLYATGGHEAVRFVALLDATAKLKLRAPVILTERPDGRGAAVFEAVWTSACGALTGAAPRATTPA
jgi:hypothetical protein